MWQWWDIQTSEVDAKCVPINVGHESLYADRSSKDEQLLIRPLLQIYKNTNIVGS
jgi:hypothetical protein